MSVKIVVTGHRPGKLGGYNNNSLQNIAIRDCFISILSQTKKKHHDLSIITGMALGFDQIVAQACIETDTSFIAHVPFSGQEKRWPHNSQQDYTRILSCASDVKYCSEPPQTKGEAVKAMMVRNSSMINEDGVVACISCWDGSKSGTKDAIVKAIKKDLWICNINPNNTNSFEVLWSKDIVEITPKSTTKVAI